jgi:hypothetical protein
VRYLITEDCDAVRTVRLSWGDEPEPELWGMPE